MGQIILQAVSRFQSKRILILSQLLLLILALSTIQDLLHSRRNDYSFYLTESLLFNSFWILFFPLAYVLYKCIHSKKFNFKNTSVYANLSVLVLGASVLHILLYSLIINTVSAFFFQHEYLFLNILNYSLTNDLYKYPLVYGAIVSFLFQKSRVKTLVENDNISFSKNKAPAKIMIQKGRDSIAIETKDILSIVSCSPYIAIQTNDKKYLHTDTLKSIQEKLDKDQFVRIHKSSIIQLDKVSSFRSRLNGDYDILMKNGDILRLSRNYLKGFKEQMEKSAGS